MEYSRQQPSPRYESLLRMYQEMHLHGERHQGIPAQKTFDGRSLAAHLERIKGWIDQSQARSVLDYGSGKGTQYDPRPISGADGAEHDGVVDYWGVDEVTCFDPAYGPYSRLPTGVFDGVISTDVLEHCPKEDIGWIVGEMFGYAEKFVYAVIACYPAVKRLPNGENAHCTIEPPEWWAERFKAAGARHPGVKWEIRLQTVNPDGSKREQGIASA
jgi:hypothetical protein